MALGWEGSRPRYFVGGGLLSMTWTGVGHDLGRRKMGARGVALAGAGPTGLLNGPVATKGAFLGHPSFSFRISRKENYYQSKFLRDATSTLLRTSSQAPGRWAPPVCTPGQRNTLDQYCRSRPHRSSPHMGVQHLGPSVHPLDSNMRSQDYRSSPYMRCTEIETASPHWHTPTPARPSTRNALT